MMKLLLHVCCAPCLIYPLEVLRAKGFQVSGFFYNPNIHPLDEYQKRKTAVENFSRQDGAIEIVYPEYAPEEFLEAVKLNQASPKRCFLCWSLRLSKTASFAKTNGFPGFSTTLLVSPYQDQEALQKIGASVAAKNNIEFYGENFRPGFRKAHDLAKKQGLYCQHYCGCIYSERERSCR